LIRHYCGRVFEDLPWTVLPIPAQEQTARSRPSIRSVRARQKIADIEDLPLSDLPLSDLQRRLAQLDAKPKVRNSLRNIQKKRVGKAAPG
jgi:hypothetical protein